MAPSKMAEYPIGKTLNLLYPLGNSFSDPLPNKKKVLLIGGGVGIAPMLMLGADLKRKDLNPFFY